MIDYLVGISQNLVAEVIVVGFTLGVWQFLKRRWKTVRPAALSQWGAVVERHLTRSVAFILFVAFLFVTEIDDALGGVEAAFVALVNVSAGAIYIGGLFHVSFKTSWLRATRIAYWLAFIAVAIAWVADPHVLLQNTVPIESARAFGLLAAGVALLGVQAVPLWLAPDPSKRRKPFPWRNLFLVSTAGTVIGAVLLRDRFSWQEALASGPITGVLVNFALAMAFMVVLDAASALTSWGDRHGWITYRPRSNEEQKNLAAAPWSKAATADDEFLTEVPAVYLSVSKEATPQGGSSVESSLRACAAVASLGRDT